MLLVFRLDVTTCGVDVVHAEQRLVTGSPTGDDPDQRSAGVLDDVDGVGTVPDPGVGGDPWFDDEDATRVEMTGHRPDRPVEALGQHRIADRTEQAGDSVEPTTEWEFARGGSLQWHPGQRRTGEGQHRALDVGAGTLEM